MGYGGGYCSLHGQGLFPEHPYDADGTDHDGEPSKAAEVCQKQKHSGDRRFRQRQDAVLLQAVAAASSFILCLHRSERDFAAGDRHFPGTEKIPYQMPQPDKLPKIHEIQPAGLRATRGRVIKLFGADRTCYSISSSLSSPKRLATAVRQHDEKR